MIQPPKFDPRDMITSPYRICPKCGNETFGVLIIDRTTYTRCCRDCGHKVEVRLPKLRKRIIYLDQFVISNLMRLKNPTARGHDKVKANNPFWQELNDLLFKLQHLQLIACPYFESHEQESLTFEFGDELKKMYESLSSGSSFIEFDRIKSQQIEELALAWSQGREPEFDCDPKRVLHKNPNEWDKRHYVSMGNSPFVSATNLREFRRKGHTRIARLFNDVWRVQKQSFSYWYEQERKGYQGALREAYIRRQHERMTMILAHKPGAELSLEQVNIGLRSFPETLHDSLRMIFRFPRNGNPRTAEETQKMEKAFGDDNRIAEAPFVKLMALMFAAIAMRAAGTQKDPPNEGTTTDVDTVAHLLPYCDAMFMDNGCRSLLQDVPRGLRPTDAAKVFSLKTKAAFLDYLRGIRASISVEQIQAVRDVYGEKYTI